MQHQQQTQAITKIQTTLPIVSCFDKPQTSSLKWRQRGEIVKQRFGSDNDFRLKVNPDTWRYFGAAPDKAITGDYPILRDIDNAYGDGFSVEWLLPHLAVLSASMGVKNIDKDAGKMLAQLISTEYSFLKITELLLFFYWFMTGRYGRFYGSFDPLVVMCALKDFMEERGNEIERHRQKEQEEKDRESRKNAISWEEYCRREYGEVKPPII